MLHKGASFLSSLFIIIPNSNLNLCNLYLNFAISQVLVERKSVSIS